MRRFSALILLLAYLVVFLNTSASVARAAGVTKITVSHDVNDHHDDDHKPCPKPHQHSHELAVGGHAVHTTQTQAPVVSFTKDPSPFTKLRPIQVPVGPSLLGIFRPPIAA